jgi:hypothetical protein
MNGLHVALLYAKEDNSFPVMEILNYLVKAGADVNLKTRDTHPEVELQGVTPLHLATSAKNITICDFLIANKADIGIKDALNRYAFDETICGSSFYEIFTTKYESRIKLMKKKEKQKRLSLRIMSKEDQYELKLEQLQKEIQDLKKKNKKLKKFKHLYKTAVEKVSVPVLVQTKESEVRTVYVSDEDSVSVGEPLLQTTIKRINIVDEKKDPEVIFEIKPTENKSDDKKKESTKELDSESLLLKQGTVVEALTLTKKSSTIEVLQDSQKTVTKIKKAENTTEITDDNVEDGKKKRVRKGKSEEKKLPKKRTKKTTTKISEPPPTTERSAEGEVDEEAPQKG